MVDMNTLPVEGKYLMYKNKPLVREGNTICYGDRETDACFLILEIIGSKTVKGIEVPSGIFIQIVDSANPAKILKQGESPLSQRHSHSDLSGLKGIQKNSK